MATSGQDLNPHIVRHDPSEMPTGLVTFLFTDVQGSTKLWEKYPEAMQVALARHDAIMRTAITTNGGVVFKTIGDAFCAAFSHAPSALLAAVDAQRMLADEPWGETGPLLVRMALHSGRTDERDGDYFGPPVNRVARLLATGHGGQILVSDDTRRLLQPDPPGETDLRDMGKKRLKDLAKPERVYQACAPGLPHEFDKLRDQPPAYQGVAIGGFVGILGLGAYSAVTLDAGENIANALSPVNLYRGFKGLIVELSTENEWFLLTIGLLFLAITAGLTFARWRAAKRVLTLQDNEPRRIARWAVNQRMIAFTGVIALIVLVAWGYQQYLWRVALPIPEDAIGFALTREASASTVQEGLADALFTQGQAQKVVVRELPVKFDATDTPKAREIGDRIGAEAVIIYRVDKADDGTESYVAYIVFTNPTVGLTVGGAPEQPVTTSGLPGGETNQSFQVKQTVETPVLRTDTLSELINAAAGIIDYHEDRIRASITHLEQAMPAQADAPNTGIISFYLGNAYSLDSQSVPAAQTLEKAAAFYEAQRQSGIVLGPQDLLILAQTYLERGRVAVFDDEWDESLTWYQKAVDLRDDLLARKDGLQRPSDVRATYARLYTLIADSYRFQGKTEDERYWRERATEEVQALTAEASPDDAYPYVQQGAALAFSGDCAGAMQALDHAIALDPDLVEAKINAGIVALWQANPELAESYFRALLADNPNDVIAWLMMANMNALDGYNQSFVDPLALEQAENYRREIIRIDPTNVDSYQTIASLVSLRALGLQLDATALLQDDLLSINKSQAVWPLDRQAVYDLYTIVIDELRVVASELRPDSPEDQAAVASAYASRGSVWSDELIGGTLMVTAVDDSAIATPTVSGTPVALDPDVQRAADLLLADVEQIRFWSDKVLNNPNASRLALLNAWAARMQALQWEWNWYVSYYYANDQAKADAIAQEMLQAANDAVALVESAPIGNTDELNAVRLIYTQAALFAGLTDPGSPLVTEYFTKAGDARAQESDEREQVSVHYSTYCTEESERIAGDESRDAGDLAAAREHYEAALVANPAHVPALIGLAHVLDEQGDASGAIDTARKATEAEPANPAAWETLAYLQTISGEESASSYQQYFTALTPASPQRRMEFLRQALLRLRAAVDADPVDRPAILTALPPIAAFLDAMSGDGESTYQYPALYAKLGEIALYGDDAAAAESYLAKAIALDPHLPYARTDLAMAAAAQGKDLSEPTTAAVQETEDPFWNETIDYNGQSVADLMVERAGAYATQFPDRQASVDAFEDALTTARATSDLAAAGVDGSTYTSPNYGYQLRWGDDWEIVTSQADGGLDWIGIAGDPIAIDVLGSLQLSELSGCLALATGVYEQNETATDFAVALTSAGEPFADSGDEHAAVAFTFVIDGVLQVVYVQCRVLDPGVSGVLVAVEMPAATYEQERAAADEVLAQLLDATGEPLGITLPDLALPAAPEPPAATPAASPVAVLPE